MDTAITIASAPAILGLVNLAKRVGMPTEAAAALAIVLGVAFQVSEYLWGASGLYQSVSAGLVMGLATAGLYDISKIVGGTTPGRHAKAEEDAA